MSGTNKHQT
jgi:hypothetical protein